MKKCKCGGDCDPYMDANGIWRCTKCGEKIDKNNHIVIGIDPFEDEGPSIGQNEDPSTSYEEEHDF